MGKLQISAGPLCVDKSWMNVFCVTMAAAAAMATIKSCCVSEGVAGFQIWTSETQEKDSLSLTS